MPRYFFNVYDGRNESDHDGMELAGWQAARVEAVQLAGRIIGDEARSVARGEHWHMEVVDEGGLTLFRLDFHVTETLAVRGSTQNAG